MNAVQHSIQVNSSYCCYYCCFHWLFKEVDYLDWELHFRCVGL